MNFYCKLIVKNTESAEYAVGSSLDHLDGIVRFYAEEHKPEIIKLWDDAALLRERIYSVNRKYREQLAKGEFPERMSYIVG